MKKLLVVSCWLLVVVGGARAADVPTSLTLKASGETAFTVSVWGRTYRYENSIFPVSVKTADREIFAAPMRLRAAFGEKEGVFTKWQYTYAKKSTNEVQVLVSADCEDMILNGVLTFAPDGFVKTDIRVIPSGSWSFNGKACLSPRLTRLWFDVDLAEASSGLFHYWPNSPAGAYTPAEDVLNSGATVCRDFPFKPYVWCGWEEGGFGISCESEEGMELADREKCISVAKTETGRRLVWRLLDDTPAAWKGKRDYWKEALSPVQYTFGLMATPVKARRDSDPDVYRRIHIYKVPEARILETGLPEKLGAAGVRYVVLHANWSRIENFGLVADPVEFQAIIDRFHRNGVKVLVYYGYEYSTLMPEWNERHADYLICNTNGNHTGGWQAANLRAYMSCYRSGWADEIRENVFENVDRFKLDGIYTDGMYMVWDCANARHGCGWTDAQGGRHATYPIFAVRKLVKDLYAGIHARGGVIESHQSACCIMPILAYADSCFDGENLQEILAKNPEFLDTDAFRCEYSGYALGLPMTFIAYTSKALPIEKLAAITLVHNVHPVVRTLEDLAYVSKIWRIFDEQGMDDAKFVPYWRENLSHTDGVKCSLYRGKKTTAVVTNLSRERKEARLDVPEGTTAVRELLSGRSYPVADGAVTLSAEPFTLYILAFDGALRDEIVLEGDYLGHLQDVWRDGTNLWWAHTAHLVRTDDDGRVIRQAKVGGHHAGLEVKDGRLYTAVCNFNGEPRGRTTPECHVMVGEYDAETLERIEMHVLDINDRAGSLCILEDGTFLVGCLRHPSLKPSEVKFHHIGKDWKLIGTHVVDVGQPVKLGIEVIRRSGNDLYLFIYNGPVMRLDAKTFKVTGRYKSFGGQMGFVRDGKSAWVGSSKPIGKGRFASRLVRRPLRFEPFVAEE